MSAVFATLLSLPTLPLAVFVAEAGVVTVGTVRIIFVARGMKVLAPLLGVVEVSIWLFAIGQVMRHLDDPACFVAFAGGFMCGNFLGILLEKKLGLGNLLVNIVSRRDASLLVERLREAEYGVTAVEGRGVTGPVQVVSTVIRRRDLDHVVGIIKGFDARAFYAVNELQAAAPGVFPGARARVRSSNPVQALRTAV